MSGWYWRENQTGQSDYQRAHNTARGDDRGLDNGVRQGKPPVHFRKRKDGTWERGEGYDFKWPEEQDKREETK